MHDFLLVDYLRKHDKQMHEEIVFALKGIQRLWSIGPSPSQAEVLGFGNQTRLKRVVI